MCAKDLDYITSRRLSGNDYLCKLTGYYTLHLYFPQYLGETTCVVVKERIKELLYSWKVGLPHETKINDAYLMLKREGIGREGE